MPTYKFDFAAIAALPEAQRAQVLEKVQEFRDQRIANPLDIFVPLHDKQRELMAAAAWARLRGFFGANRAGKTTMGVVDDIIEMCPAELVPAHLQDLKLDDWICPRYIRVVANSNKLIDSIMVPKFQEWIPRELLRGGVWSSSYEKYNHVLRLECGCRVDFLSTEMELDKHGGAALHRVHYDEEPPEEYRDEGFARTIDFNGSELFTMTPLKGLTWMYDTVFYRADVDPQVAKVTASLTDNPFLSKDGVLAVLREWADKPEQLAARVHGEFIHFGGMVYPAWRNYKASESIPHDVVKTGDIYCGIDPGILGFGLVLAAFDSFNNMFVFWAKSLKDKDVEQATKVIRGALNTWGVRESDVTFVIDPAARARSVISSATIATEFENQGIYPTHGQREREAGVIQIRRRGRLHKLIIGGDCTDLLWEMERYRIKEREDGIFDVIKKDDHCCDALRYIAMERPYDDEPQMMPSGFAPDVATGPPKRKPKVSAMGPMA